MLNVEMRWHTEVADSTFFDNYFGILLEWNKKLALPMSASSSGLSSIHKEWGRGFVEHENPHPLFATAYRELDIFN